MEREFWVKLLKWNEQAAQAAVEAAANALWPPKGSQNLAGKIENIRIAGEEGGFPFDTVTLLCASDVERASRLARSGRRVVVDCPNWRLIPWENLVGCGRVLALVKSSHEAEQALSVLESGLSGVVLESDDPVEIRAVGELIRGTELSLELIPARITSISAVGMGERACVDAAGLFKPGEGLLVGDKAAALFLVAAETSQNPFVAPRPFRVNAGGVHHYVLSPGGRTNYLSELSGGMPVLAVDGSGRTRRMVAGRIKIERRPLVRVVADCNGTEATVLLQNAETVALVQPRGELLSVAALEPGKEVLTYLGVLARHLGRGVEESVLEK